MCRHDCFHLIVTEVCNTIEVFAGIIEYLIRIELYNQRIHFCTAVNMLPFCSELSDIILLIMHRFYKLYYGCLIHFYTSKLHLKQGRAITIAITFIPVYTSKHQKFI